MHTCATCPRRIPTVSVSLVALAKSCIPHNEPVIIGLGCYNVMEYECLFLDFFHLSVSMDSAPSLQLYLFGGKPFLSPCLLPQRKCRKSCFDGATNPTVRLVDKMITGYTCDSYLYSVVYACNTDDSDFSVGSALVCC